MQDLSCANPDDMNYQELADRARYFRRDKEGQQIMSGIMEEISEHLDLPLSVVG